MYFQNATQNKLEQTLIVFIPLLLTKDLLLHRRDVVLGKGNLVTSWELENSSFMKEGWALCAHFTPSLLLISMRNCTWIFQSLCHLFRNESWAQMSSLRCCQFFSPYLVTRSPLPLNSLLLAFRWLFLNTFGQNSTYKILLALKQKRTNIQIQIESTCSKDSTSVSTVPD